MHNSVALELDEMCDSMSCALYGVKSFQSTELFPHDVFVPTILVFEIILV